MIVVHKIAQTGLIHPREASPHADTEGGIASHTSKQNWRQDYG